MGEVNEKSRGREIRRQAILDVARDVFLNDGYAAASMSAIAARVGGSKATLYNYFPSKEDLFTAMVRAHCALVQAALYDFSLDDGDIRATLTGLGVRYARAMLSDRILGLHRLVVAESARFPEIGRALHEAGPRPGQARVAALMRDAMTEGRLREADPVRAAEQFTDLCLSGLYRLRLWNVATPPTEAQIQDNVDAAIATFMAAYGVQADEPADGPARSRLASDGPRSRPLAISGALAR